MMNWAGSCRVLVRGFETSELLSCPNCVTSNSACHLSHSNVHTSTAQSPEHIHFVFNTWQFSGVLRALSLNFLYSHPSGSPLLYFFMLLSFRPSRLSLICLFLLLLLLQPSYHSLLRHFSDVFLFSLLSQLSHWHSCSLIGRSGV